MANFSLIPCGEVFGTASEERDIDNWTASVQLMCDWNDRYLLVDDILGNQNPWPYNPVLVASAAKIEPQKSHYVEDGQGMIYTYAIVSVDYGLPGKLGLPDPQDPIALASESLEPNAEFLTLDYTMFKWKASNRPLRENEAPGRLLRGLRLVRTIYKLLSVSANILSLVGTVNSRSYTSPILGLTFPAETLLFVPPTLSRTLTNQGATAWNARLSWEFKPDGWNKFWDAETEVYDTIVRVKDDGSQADYDNYPAVNQAPWLP